MRRHASKLLKERVPHKACFRETRKQWDSNSAFKRSLYKTSNLLEYVKVRIISSRLYHDACNMKSDSYGCAQLRWQFQQGSRDISCIHVFVISRVGLDFEATLWSRGVQHATQSAWLPTLSTFSIYRTQGRVVFNISTVLCTSKINRMRHHIGWDMWPGSCENRLLDTLELLSNLLLCLCTVYLVILSLFPQTPQTEMPGNTLAPLTLGWWSESMALISDRVQDDNTGALSLSLRCTMKS